MKTILSAVQTGYQPSHVFPTVGDEVHKVSDGDSGELVSSPSPAPHQQ